MAYNRILLPVDGSEHSMHAVAHAVSLVREGGEIVVATVLPPIPNVIGGDARKEAEEAVKNEPSLITPARSWTHRQGQHRLPRKDLFSIPLPPKASSKPPKT
mgnify:CR=1 FL=1